MISFETAFRQRLLTAPAVQAIVQNKVDWGTVPQEWALPNVRLTLLSGGADQNMKGFNSRVISLVRIEARADTFKKMKDLATACLEASMGPSTIDNVVIGRAIVELKFDITEYVGTGWVYTRLQDIRVTHNLV